ncbi:hypothetical protein EVAR_73485_1 [Eumeta japonica]|uniref:RNase H type-1 domain-containing protein n=1 Tax=Eumeta variegata TaxID=151549 RepID=A0A4C1TS94_EUMVA|nr:hypothetical protein EVAR_73485_1 [Eumeta japonica]
MYTTSSLVQECRASLNEMARHTNVTLKWVRGHGSDHGNNTADELARREQLFRRRTSRPSADCPLHAGGEPRETSRFTYNDFCRSCHDEEEEETVLHLLGTCRRWRAFVLDFCRRIFSDLSELSTVNLGALVSFIRGSGWL